MPGKKLKRVICSIPLAMLLTWGAMTGCAWAQTQNPAATPSTNPLANPPGGVDIKTLHYSEIGSNNSGRALYSDIAGTSAKAALITGMHDVEKILGVHVVVTSAFDDSKEDRGGGANFTATVNGTPVKGSVLVGIGNNGAAISILYAVANAPAGDWSQLLADLPASIKLTDTSFGDGAGTIGVPDGWKIASANNMGTVVVTGPDNEQVAMEINLLVLPPGSEAAQSQTRVQQLAIRFGQKPAQGSPILPYSAPLDAYRGIFQYWSQLSVSNGGPAQEVKEIINSKEMPNSTPQNDTVLIYSRNQIDTPGQPTVRRAISQVTCAQLAAYLQGEWSFEISSLSAPDAIFDRQLPTLLAVSNSFKPDTQKIVANGQTNIAGMQAALGQTMKNMQASQDATDQTISDMNRRQLAADRSFDDEDEIIRGYRTVEDTETGDQSDVNLEDSHAIVDKLNEGDPGRYIEIPLRDQVDPF